MTPGCCDRWDSAIRSALALVILALPFMDLEVFQIAGRSIVLPYVAVAGLTGIVLCRPGALGEFLRTDYATPFLFGWLFIAALSSAAAFYRSQEPDMLAANGAQLANLCIMAGHYVVIGAALRLQPRPVVTRLVDLFVVTAVAGGLLSIYQVGSVVFGWPYVDVLRTSNLYFHNNTLTWNGGGSWISFPRAIGSAPEPTFWAGYLSVGLAVALGRLTQPLRPIRLAQAALIAVGLALTFARAAVPAVAVVVACWAWIAWRKRLPIWLGPAVVGLAFVATVSPAFMHDRWLTLLDDHSAIERLSSTVAGIRMMEDFPFIGVGPGSVPFLTDQYNYVIGERRGIGFSNLYSFLASVLATTGIIGALCLACFLIEVVRRLQWLHASGRTGIEERSVVVSAFLAFACIVVYWVGSAAYNMSFLWFCYALAAGLPGARVRTQNLREAQMTVGGAEWPARGIARVST